MECDQCGKPAIRKLAGHPLCVSCYATMQRVEIDRQRAEADYLDALERSADYASQQMDFIAGFGPPPRYKIGRPVHMTAPTFNNLNIQNSAVGVLNTGTIHQLDSAITAINEAGGNDVAAAIRELTEAVAQAKDIAEEARRDGLHMLNAIAEQAKMPRGDRSKGLLSITIEGLERMIRTSASLVTLWPVLAPYLEKLIPN